jgi:hypothetical protein
VVVTARELAAEIVARVPQHSLGERVRTAVAGASDTRECGRCPRCGRALPLGSMGPAFQSIGSGGPIGIPITPQERIHACLVDGPRASHAEDLPLAELIEAAEDIRVALESHGWKQWARRLARAIHASDSSNEQAEQIGQTLETFRRFGPTSFNPDPELDVLVTSLARYWPQKPDVS